MLIINHCASIRPTSVRSTCSAGDDQGGYVAVERRGEIDGLEQLGRYLERL
jgi:hypothetical protein